MVLTDRIDCLMAGLQYEVPAALAVSIVIADAVRQQLGRPALDGPHSTLLTRVCMGCGCWMGVKDGRGAAGGPSHGICPQCFLEVTQP